MNRQTRIGALAYIRANSTAEVPFLAVWSGRSWSAVEIDGFFCVEPVTRRDLVVIDPTKSSDLLALADALLDHGWTGGSADTRAALKQYADPKPPEPKNLGAVVRDVNGVVWVRVNNTHWIADDPQHANNRQTYGELNVVDVLSEGWLR